MVLISVPRYIEFTLLDGSSVPITGVTLSDLGIFFTRNTVTCTDPLSLVYLSNGRYVLEYTPTTTGHDYIEITYAPTNKLVINTEDIYSSRMLLGETQTISFTQDWGSVGRFKVTLDNPNTYTLYVFNSSDYAIGKNIPTYALASTGIDTNGNWVTPSITLLHGTYSVVLFGSSGARILLASNLQV